MRYSKRRRKDIDQFEDEEVQVEAISLEKSLELFLNAQEAANNSQETHKNYKIAINLFFRYIVEVHKHTSIDQIEEADVVGWLVYLRNTNSRLGTPYSKRSIQTYSRDIAVFFSWLVQHGHLDFSPMSDIKSPKVERALIRVFSEDELKILDAACDRTPKGKALTSDERKALASRDRAFLWLLLSTGVRLSEACGLLFSDIDWDKNMIYVRGKGSKERRIPFGKVARQHLDTYIRYWRGGSSAPDEHVFLNAFGSPLRKPSANAIFVRLKDIAGITDKRVSAHTCRHWFAVNAIKNGMPTIVLKDLLGHENWAMIEVYVRLAEQDRSDLYTRFSPVDRLDMHHTAKGKRQEARDWRNARKQGKTS